MLAHEFTFSEKQDKSRIVIFEHTDYRHFLKASLADRIADNDAYSLRAFATKLGLSNSFLSEVLRAKKTLSLEAATQVAMRLELTESESQYFSLLVQIDSQKDPEVRDALLYRAKQLNPKRPINNLSIDSFKMISDWQHFAILELTGLSRFELTPKAAAQKLGISVIEAEAAIERLLRLELLEREKTGKLKKTDSYVLAESGVPIEAFKKFHKQLLEQAMQSLISQTPSERVSSSDILPLDSKYLPEIKRITDELTAQVLKISAKSKRRDHVYCLGMHFFKLTK